MSKKIREGSGCALDAQHKKSRAKNPGFYIRTFQAGLISSESFRRSCRAQHAALSALDALYRFFLLYSSALSLGEIIIVTAQNGLYVFLKIFAELANFLLYIFFRFRLRT
jgi:hypothetical protein